MSFDNLCVFLTLIFHVCVFILACCKENFLLWTIKIGSELSALHLVRCEMMLAGVLGNKLVWFHLAKIPALRNMAEAFPTWGHVLKWGPFGKGPV